MLGCVGLKFKEPSPPLSPLWIYLFAVLGLCLSKSYYCWFCFFPFVHPVGTPTTACLSFLEKAWCASSQFCVALSEAFHLY